MILDATMTDERAARLLAALPGDDAFIVKIKFLRWDNQEWIIKDKFDPVRKDQRIVEISRNTRPGVLTGTDKVYYQNAYPVTAVIYGLYFYEEPDPVNLPPMRDGDLNCVAQRVIEHFDNALRGKGLTENRRKKIMNWEQTVNEKGATIYDVRRLETVVKRSIIIKDIAGESIYDSGRYESNNYRSINLIAHNGHAWSKDLHFPISRQIHYYEGDVLEAIQEVTRGNPFAVWLLGGDANTQKFSVNQFVLQDGRAFRTRETHERLQEICTYLGDSDLAQRAFGINHAASIMAKEKNGWKPTSANFLSDIQKACIEHGYGGLWNLMGHDIEQIVSIDMKSCYPASFQGEGEAKPHFERFGHPMHRMTRVLINGALPNDIGTGFAGVQNFAFKEGIHPVIPLWFGKHFKP